MPDETELATADMTSLHDSPRSSAAKGVSLPYIAAMVLAVRLKCSISLKV
jgi:hypothetical protein